MNRKMPLTETVRLGKTAREEKRLVLGDGGNGQDLLYLQVYEYYRELIRSGMLRPGTKLPSIRKCSVQLELSRTTVETAYMMLAAEGYIVSRPQSGYYVTEFAKAQKEEWENRKQEREAELPFDFSSSRVDRDSFRFEVWRRYVKSALRQDERLLSYGEPQGEAELREELCRYLNRHRNVICTPEQIVVGAGVQSLLNILCPMVKERRQVIMHNPGFHQGRTIFEDHGFHVTGMPAEGKMPAPGSIYYLTPSQLTSWGDVMGMRERMELIREARKRDVLIIEDDYNSEFCYYSRPVSSLQGLSGGRGVVYMGTFSRLLLPSIRLSFMVLAPELLDVYKNRGKFYNQTASKAEQIALCQFIRDGHLEGQIRKSRRLYSQKAKLLGAEIEKVFGDKAKACLGEAGFLVLMELKTKLSHREIRERAKASGVGIRTVEQGEQCGEEAGVKRLLLSCASLPSSQYEEALLRLKAALE